jgi:glyoxalase family protein
MRRKSIISTLAMKEVPLTFFSYPGIPKGRKGTGQLTVTSFSIPENSIPYWMKRLEQFKPTCAPSPKLFKQRLCYMGEGGTARGISWVKKNIFLSSLA